MRTIALQLYTVRHALERNPEETLCRVRKAGYTAVETAPLPPSLTTRQLSQLLRDTGLRVIAAHCDLPLGERRSEVLAEAAQLGAPRLIWHGWPRDPDCNSLDGYRRLAERYTDAAEAARAHGLQFGLHNHWWEFEALDGLSPYHLLHQLLPPEIFFELDVYWAQTASQNPLQIMRDLGARLAMLHLKDGPATHGRPMMALGEGLVDIASILRATPNHVDGVVELDECATDPLEAARRSFDYLTRAMLAAMR